MITHLTPFLEAKNDAGRGLRVTFLWNRDRYSHTIAALDGARVIPLLASVDGTDGCNDGPESSPLQQLSIESHVPPAQVGLLVGMAGRNHYSASVQPIPGEAGFLFDFALRTLATPPFVGSRYRTMVAANLIDSQIVHVKLDGLLCKILVEPPANLTAEPDDNGFTLRCRESPDRFPATIRWTYRVSVQ